jgi:hypothetical protein
MEKILYNCILSNSKSLKRRINIVETPVEFQRVELVKQVQDNLNSFQTPIKEANIVFAPENVTVIPTQPVPQYILEQQVDITPINVPNEIQVVTSQPHFKYEIGNQSSNVSYIFTFTDVSGGTSQKILKPGGTATICALEDTVSVSDFNNAKSDGDYGTSFQKNKLQYSIHKLSECDTISVGEGAPIQTNTNATVPPGHATPHPQGAPEPISTPIRTGPVVPTPSAGGCFVEGTFVTLANGAKIVIEEVVKGMEVLTWNEESGQQEAGVVTDLIRPISSDIISIDLGNESIECTTDHPIFVIGKGWSSYNPIKTKEIHKMVVAELVDGDLVLNSSDETVSINTISPIMTLIPIQTYNLSIEGNHTYYANGILVHNKMDSSTIGGVGGEFSGTVISNYNGATFGE